MGRQSFLLVDGDPQVGLGGAQALQQQGEHRADEKGDFLP